METPLQNYVEQKIFSIRGIQVMLDSDLAQLFEVETKVFNQAVKRNSNRFPSNFRFQLTKEEYNLLRSQFVTLKQAQGQHRKYLPFAFTEQGVAMLSSVFQRIDQLEIKQLQSEEKFEKLFKALDNNILKAEKGIFFNGQVFDAYAFFSESHDRFIIIDQTELYHIGASLKDLGKKWFAFSRMDSLAGDLLKKLKY